MKLDKIISKYLDGNLSPDEDKFLRQSIADNEVARDEFYTHVELNHLLKEDASKIKTPNTLFSATEDMVLMQIMAKDINLPTLTRSNKKFIFARYSAVAAVLLLIFNVLNIDENFNNLSFEPALQSFEVSNLGIDEQVKITGKSSNKLNALNKQQAKISNFTSVKSVGLENDEESNIISSNLDQISQLPVIEITDIPVLSSNNEILEQNVDVSIILEPNSVKSSDLLVDQQVIANSNITFGGGTNNPNYNTINNEFLPLKPTKVKLSSLVHYENLIYDETAFEANIERSFSQSIAYELNHNSRFGFELGLMQLNFKEDRFVMRRIPGVGGEADLYVEVPVTTNNNSQMIWVSGFYEVDLLQTDDFAVNTRLGGGFSMMGMLGFSRLQASYNVFDFAALTLGLNTRFFKTNLGTRSNVNSTWLTSYGLSTGIQFNF